MRKRYVIRWFIFLSLTLVGLVASAQWHIGLESGLDFNTIKTNISNVPGTKYVEATAYQCSVPIMQYWVKSYLGFEAAPALLQKDYRLVWTGKLDSNFQITRGTYLQLPLAADCSWEVWRFRVTGQFGGYGAYWLYGRVKGSLPDPFTGANYSYDSAWVFDGRRDERWEFGWLAGARVAYNFEETWQLFMEGRYYYSITNQQRNDFTGETPRYNRTWVASVGALFKLTCK